MLLHPTLQAELVSDQFKGKAETTPKRALGSRNFSHNDDGTVESSSKQEFIVSSPCSTQKSNSCSNQAAIFQDQKKIQAGLCGMDIHLHIFPTIPMQTKLLLDLCKVYFEQALVMYCMERLYSIPRIPLSLVAPEPPRSPMHTSFPPNVHLNHSNRSSPRGTPGIIRSNSGNANVSVAKPAANPNLLALLLSHDLFISRCIKAQFLELFRF